VDHSKVRIGLLGFGTVGQALVTLIEERADEIAERTGVWLEIVRVALRDPSKPRQVQLPRELMTQDPFSVVQDPQVDVVVELMGGTDPALSLVTQALRSGKPVVTANKEMLARFPAELAEAQRAGGAPLRYEASVAGAIPLVRALGESLVGEPIWRVMGIVNGTTNYILSSMSDSGLEMSEALAEAKALGFAEADPTADLEGFDAAAKAAILASLAFGCEVTLDQVYREGITDITQADITFAKQLGYEVRLLAIIERKGPDGQPSSGPSLAVRVHPAMVERSHPLASVRGSFNAVFIEGQAAGELMLYGRGAGGRPTASAVLGDLVEAAQVAARGGISHRQLSPQGASPACIVPMAELTSECYLSLDVADRPGVLAAVATVFGRHGVSIRSMEQVGLSQEARLVFLTHEAREADIQATIGALKDLDVVEHVGSLIRVVETRQ
jgi:homoserine dehydrogenase